MNGSVVKFAYMWSVYIFAHEKFEIAHNQKRRPSQTSPFFIHRNCHEWVREREGDNVSLASPSPPSPDPSTRTKRRDLCCVQGNFFDFSQNHFSCCRVENTPTLAVYFKTAAVKKKKKEKENCFLIMERRRRVRREFFHWFFRNFSLNPETKQSVLFSLLFSVVNDFSVACVALSWIWIFKALETALAPYLHTHRWCEWYQFRFSDRLQFRGRTLVCLFSAPRVLQSN